MNVFNTSWAEINLDNLENNIKELKKVADDTKICAVIKANAYGHGATTIAKFLEEIGIGYFAVSSLSEALELRCKGIKSNVMMLTALFPGSEELAIENDIESTVFNYDQAENLSRVAISKGKKYNIHIKLDTGMRRIGFRCNRDSIDEIIKISRLDGINLKGVFTHFASADEAHNILTTDQYRLFLKMVDELKDEGIKFEVKHVDNDAALLMYNYREDMIRLGIGLYGIYPSEFIKAKTEVKLRPVMRLKSIVTNVKEIQKGESVGYGQTYTALKETKVATVGIGYADGMPRVLSNKGTVQIKGVNCPIIGRICMDQLMCDVTDLDDVNIGDLVIIFGDENNSEQTVSDIAALAGTISYEILTGVNYRVPRIYLRGNKLIKRVNYLLGGDGIEG